jgi:crotonobetainyl-CoA:carnitine CoA-transferase CaiB-like acyl-CoA transferase
MESSLADYQLAGVVRGRSGGVLPGVSPSNGYPSRDGVEILIAANADTVFARLCGAMGRPGLLDDPRFATHSARGEHSDELDAEIARWTEQHTAEALVEFLAADQIPAGRIYTAADAIEDPHYLAREMIVHALSSTGQETPMTGIVPKFSATPGAVRSAGPSLGADTVAVLKELAELTDDEYADLRERGIL